MTQISKQLEREILRAWDEIEPRATSTMQRVQSDYESSYIEIPFVAKGICKNAARWNKADESFDQMRVPVWRGQEVRYATIMLPTK